MFAWPFFCEVVLMKSKMPEAKHSLIGMARRASVFHAAFAKEQSIAEDCFRYNNLQIFTTNHSPFDVSLLYIISHRNSITIQVNFK